MDDFCLNLKKTRDVLSTYQVGMHIYTAPKLVWIE